MPKTLKIVLPIVGVLIILLIGGMVFQGGGTESNTDSEMISPTSTPPGESAETMTQVPELTPAPTASTAANLETVVDISKYSVRVENGSGVSGDAGTAENLLEEHGFSVKSAGNADSFDYEQTEIHYSSKVAADAVEQVKVALKDTYAIGEVFVDEEINDDIVIILGAERV